MGEKVASLFRELPSPAPAPISNVHTDILYRSAALLLATPLCYPRFFFQQLQQTSLKLSVNPQPRSAGEPVGISASQQLAVKVEGVVASSKKLQNPWRTVEAVEVVVASSLVAPSKSTQLKQPSQEELAALAASCEQRLEQTATPHNDFFSAQFLVPFPVAGSHQLTVETRLVDADMGKWRTGQASAVNVKVFEDGQNRPSAAARTVNR